MRWPEIRKSRGAAILLIGVVVGIAGGSIGKVAGHFAQHQAADAQHAFFKQTFEGLEQFGLLGIDLRLVGQVDGGPSPFFPGQSLLENLLELEGGGTLWPLRLRTGRRPRRNPESTTASSTAGMMIVSVLKIHPTRAIT